MGARSQSISMTVLRWTLGVVVLWESLRFAVSATSAHHLAGIGLPHWTAPLLGAAEVLAAILFLLPKTAKSGGFLLLLIFAVASVLHLLHREYHIETLLVYIAATWACIVAGA
jgi:uncharacterized membrane protein YphA (DoxX/SURF4 family)